MVNFLELRVAFSKAKDGRTHGDVGIGLLVSGGGTL